MCKRQSSSLLIKLTAALVVLLSACPSGVPGEQPSTGGGAGGGGASGSTGGGAGSTGGGALKGSGGGQTETPPDAGTPVDTVSDSGTPGPSPDGGTGERPVADRILFFFVPHGIDPTKFLPKGSDKDFTLSPLMKALEPYKSKLTIVDRLKAAAFPAACQGYSYFSFGPFFAGTAKVAPFPNVSIEGTCVPTSASIDQLLAKELSSGTKYTSIHLDVFTQPKPDRFLFETEAISFAGDDNPTPVFKDPKPLIDEVLSSNGPASVVAAFTKLRAARMVFTEPLDSLKDYKSLARLNLDVALAALQGDLTRVAVVQLGMNRRFSWLRGTPALGIGSVAHDGSQYNVSINDVHEWALGEFAYLLGQLESTKESDGSTMLDHTLVVWVTESGRAGLHELDNIPAIVAGNAPERLTQGQALKATGTQLDLFLTLAKALGSKATTFGDPKHNAKPIAEMLK